MKKVQLIFQGINLEVHSDCDDFLSNVQKHLPQQMSTVDVQPDITVRVSYQVGTYGEHRAFRFDDFQSLERIGYDTYRGDNRIDWTQIWALQGLKISATRNGKAIGLEGVFHEIRDENTAIYLAKKLLKSSFFKERRHDLHNQLLEYLIYHPLSWYLELNQGKHIFHSSGVEVNGKALIFPGLSGVGKSTVSTYLFSKLQGRFLSDNLLYYDTEKVYSCFEPILLSEKSASWIPPDDKRVIQTKLTSVYERKGYLIDPEFLVDSAIPGWAFLLSFSKVPYIRPIRPDKMGSHLLDSNEATGETKRYHTFSAKMNMLFDQGSLAVKRGLDLEKLLAGVQCFEVGLPYDGDLPDAIDRTILTVL